MRKQHIFEGRPSFSNCYYEISNSTVANFVGCVYKRLLLMCKRALQVSCDTTAITTARSLIDEHGEALKKLLEILTTLVTDWPTMQAFTSPYVCPYFTCSSPYCLALRSSAVASSLSVNRPPTSPSSQSGGISSFTISSILSRSEEQTSKAARSEETSVSKPSSEVGSLSQFSPYTSHVSVERFHPYHRPLTASAFARTTCNALQKGEP